MEKHSGGGGGFSGEKSPESADNEKAAVDLFYEKLAKLNESSGLSLLFNLRETKLDLHLVYKEVIKLGGYYQVTKKGKWEDVACVSNPKSGVSMSATQLQNLYKMFIFQYELLYCRDSLGCFGPRANPSWSLGKGSTAKSRILLQHVNLRIEMTGETERITLFALGKR